MSARRWNRSGLPVRLMPIHRLLRGRGWFRVDGSLVVVPLVAAALEGALAWLAVTRLGARVHSPRGVLNRLDRSDGRWSVNTGRFTQTWNPADEAGGRVTGKGRATYWIDDSGLIHLLFEPLDGPPRTLVGPRPALEHRGRVRAVIALSIAVALAALATGGTMGYLAGGIDDRFNGTMFGALIGLIVAWVDWPVIAALAFRRTRACRS
jgi:hypothetical protein